MRLIKYIIVHCTAGNQNQTVADVKKWWKEGMRWKNVGYHFLITKDGVAHRLAEDSQVTNGVAGFNANSLHVSYCGGIDSKGNTLDNRTLAQKTSLEAVVIAWKKLYPDVIIKGHRDFSPDKNKDGKITSNEYIKNCPAFEVSTWLKGIVSNEDILSSLYYPTVLSWTLKFLLFCSIYFAPVLASMISIFIFIVVDFFTGIWVARTKGIPITSKKMRNTFGKSLAYMIGLLIAHIFELQFLAGALPLMKILALFIATAEIKSIFENLGVIANLDFWEFIKKKLGQNEEKKT